MNLQRSDKFGDGEAILVAVPFSPAVTETETVYFERRARLPVDNVLGSKHRLAGRFQRGGETTHYHATTTILKP